MKNIKRLPPQQTRVTFRYNVLARPTLLRPVLHPLLKLVFAGDMRQRFHALREAAAQPSLMASDAS